MAYSGVRLIRRTNEPLPCPAAGFRLHARRCSLASRGESRTQKHETRPEGRVTCRPEPGGSLWRDDLARKPGPKSSLVDVLDAGWMAQPRRAGAGLEPLLAA